MKSRSRTSITNEPSVTAWAALWLSKHCHARSLLTSISPPTRRTTAELVLSVTARRLLCISAAREPSWLSAACADVPTAAVCIIAGSRRFDDLLGRRPPRPEEVAGVAVKPKADRFHGGAQHMCNEDLTTRNVANSSVELFSRRFP